MKLKILIGKCGDPYLVRLELFRLFGWSLKLHIFLRGDEDKELHDHPWSFWTLVLCGSYIEEVPWEQVSEPQKKLRWYHLNHAGINGHSGNAMITRRRWSLAFRPSHWRHRVLINEYCATLVLCAPPSREWGFYSGKTFIPWQKFVSSRDC